MSIKELTKSGTFVLGVLVLVVLLLPFAVEQIGETTDLYSFPVTKRLKGLFSSAPAQKGANVDAKVDWEALKNGLEGFSTNVEGFVEATISIVRPEEFQVVRADSNPVTSSRFSWKLLRLSGDGDVTATQIRSKLELICAPAEKIEGKIAAVKPLRGGEKGFLVTVDDVSGEGKVGLSYAGQPPVYYDVKLRRMWLVPVASCRSAMKDRYEAAVYFPGVEKGVSEGTIISPGDEKCGYRILSISDRCVWFEAFYGDEPTQDALPHSIWPDFSRIETMEPIPPPGRLVFGKSRCFWPGDAIKLPNSSFYLMVDDFLDGQAIVFRLLDAAMHPVRELLCVIVREK